MAFILEEITGGVDSDAYVFAEVTTVFEKTISVRTTSGLEILISIGNENYAIGDQVVLGSYNSNYTNAFIIKKLETTYPTAINYPVDLDQD